MLRLRHLATLQFDKVDGETDPCDQVARVRSLTRFVPSGVEKHDRCRACSGTRAAVRALMRPNHQHSSCSASQHPSPRQLVRVICVVIASMPGCKSWQEAEPIQDSTTDSARSARAQDELMLGDAADDQHTPGHLAVAGPGWLVVQGAQQPLYTLHGDCGAMVVANGSLGFASDGALATEISEVSEFGFVGASENQQHSLPKNRAWAANHNRTDSAAAVCCPCQLHGMETSSELTATPSNRYLARSSQLCSPMRRS